MEDLRAIGSGICGEEEEAKCGNEFGDKLEWTCKECKKKKAGDLDLYTMKLLRIRGLRMGGYPFSANDLTPEEWEDLGKVEQWVQTLGA